MTRIITRQCKSDAINSLISKVKYFFILFSIMWCLFPPFQWQVEVAQAAKQHIQREQDSLSLPEVSQPVQYANQQGATVGNDRNPFFPLLAFVLLQLIIILLMVSNIIGRKRAERNLRQSENNFRGIFEHVTEGLFQATETGKLIKVNQSLVKILKCDSPEDVLSYYDPSGSNLYANKKQRDTILQLVMDTGKAQKELELFCKDGSKIIALFSCHKVVDDTGKTLYLEGSITDMTEYKKTQEMIIHTEKMVSLGGVSAGIAHEINNPLNAIIQTSQVIKSRLLGGLPKNIKSAKRAGISLQNLGDYLQDREIPYLLENIIDSGNRAHIIIEDMLSFSKKNIGEFSPHSLLEVTREAVELLQKDYSLKNGYDFKSIQLEYTVEKELPPVYCSGTKIRQVLFNILKNCAEAMEEEGTPDPRIAIKIAQVDNSVKLEIQDNGPGVEPAVRERIFEPFFTTKEGKKGTGLGLSVSYFIITENHKGSLSVKSALGNGTTFIMELPLENSQGYDLAPLLEV